MRVRCRAWSRTRRRYDALVKSGSNRMSTLPVTGHTVHSITPATLSMASLKSTRQCRVTANCLVTKADSPRTVMNDVPCREGCTEPLNPEPAGGMCKIS